MALLDEGETDWKVIVIDVNDPLAPRLNDIEDVERHLPGLIRATSAYRVESPPSTIVEYHLTDHRTSTPLVLDYRRVVQDLQDPRWQARERLCLFRRGQVEEVRRRDHPRDQRGLEEARRRRGRRQDRCLRLVDVSLGGCFTTCSLDNVS
jgi:hypothetical protein